MTTHYSELIRDAASNRLRISPTQLIQVSPDHISDNPWYAKAGDIRAAYRRAKASRLSVDEIKVYEKNRRKKLKSLRVSFVLPTHTSMEFQQGYGYIGCAMFTAEVFNQIMKKVRRPKASAKAGR